MRQMIFYSPPDGPAVDDARLEDILDRILNGDYAYWSAGAAHATVYVGKHGGGAPNFTLMLTKHGFYVEAIFTERVNGRRKRVAYVPDATLGRTDVDEPWAGQNAMRIPRDFCLSREQCAEAVRYFCETGERDPRVNWVQKRSTGWNFNLDD